MAAITHVKILEQCHLSPSPDSNLPSTSLPLTFLDIPWLFYSPNLTLFFFTKPDLKPTTIIPLLKQSLSLTLHHFHPFAGNLSSPPPPSTPQIVYCRGDAVSVTIAESNANIHHLSGHHPRDAAVFHSLAPPLPPPSAARDAALLIPLVAVQMTVFRDAGFCIGVSAQHVVADERTLDHFVKTWASNCKSLSRKDSNFSLKSEPWFDRTVISDPSSLKTAFLKQWWNQPSPPKCSFVENDDKTYENMVRATFTLNPSDINKIKHHILAKCKAKNHPPPMHLAPYVSACSFTWVCLLKAQATHDNNLVKGPLHFGFNAGAASRLGYETPTNYFGNCIAFGRCKAMGGELVGEDGVVLAAKAIGKEIKRLDSDVLGGGERWVCDWGELNARVLGSPKVGSYGVDFGWGKVDKIEKISCEDHGGVDVISLTESRDSRGGIDIGVVLPRVRMSVFISLFNGGLKEFAC